MAPLRWSWTVRLGPYVRGTVGSQPWLWAAVPAIVAGVFLLTPRAWSPSTRLVAGGVVALLAVAAFLSSLRRQLVRRRLSERGRVQTYALAPDTLVLGVGKDSYTLPSAELVVTARGPDWLAVRRPSAGRRPLLLFFDEPGLLPQAETLLRAGG